jgi:hypothetical protein
MDGQPHKHQRQKRENKDSYDGRVGFKGFPFGELMGFGNIDDPRENHPNHDNQDKHRQ